MQTVKFNELPVSDYILKAVEEMGWTEASPIQSAAIEVVMKGTDMIGQAQTGTGKTAAFGIPAIEAIDVEDRFTQVLIMCPTRELALQVKEQIYQLSKYKKGLLVSSIYGGESYERQFRDLKKGAHIVVGTPGRIMDHIERKTLKLETLKMLILDEADEMLNMGFREDIEKILSFAPAERQTVLFSATMSRDIMSITKRFQNNPEVIKITKKEVTNDNIEQLYYNVRRESKTELMCRLIDVNDLKLMLVFCNTKAMVDRVTMELQDRGYKAEAIHGDLSQSARNQVMNKFRNKNCTILCATDVAARGIDVNDVDAVFNYDVPLDTEYYVHRIGRTGRAGKKGQAFLFVSNRDRNKLRELERYTKVAITEGKVPTKQDMKEIQTKNFMDKIVSHISEEGNGEYESIIEALGENGHSTAEVVTALMKMQLDLSKTTQGGDDLSDGRGGRGGRESSRDRGDRGGERRGGGRFERRGDRDFESRDRGGRSRDRDRGDRGRGGERSGGEREGARRPHRGANGSGEPGMVRLFINLGKKDHVSPNHIVGALAAEAKIPGRVIGQIDMYDKFSFVEVPERDVNKVISGMDGKTINARQAEIEVAK
ncbi:DEAD/DEAH box helicase [Arcticibacterium luteifluviistationis]|uniref:DEAD-box ATP-dependent RNA helicase RhpA n=1 Tax=Arcticibacterium luteifluviistationis TaxID=1784714 RepID=A0A2Z4GD85_9BACT|nr:DEAD/DEAH box helicase [Arcticibacterium luteifluviistationis]AWV98985.1 ATP-dependent RNA helicase [Arcticibacterium luteifluviistationis]